MRASLQENIAADLGDYAGAARHAQSLEELSEGLTIVGGEAPICEPLTWQAPGTSLAPGRSWRGCPRRPTPGLWSSPISGPRACPA
uniref:Uncharacterized protein n=1 Tax=Phenylobacterium glaciei TaxID=2803784 RepID=A0A974S8C3_9CAUL|nr:hypothetical protein JKL49_06715 [Phenylobacterium glaciei]